MNLNNRKGFTLIEVMVTVAIIGTLAAIGIPNYLSSLPEKRLKIASRDLYINMQKAKIMAIKRNREVAISFVTAACGTTPPSSLPSASGSYVVFIDDGSGTGTAADGIRNGTELIIKNGGPFPGVALCTAAFGSTSPPSLSFRPQGLPANPGSVVFYNNMQKSYTVTVTNAGLVRLH